jgi:hypothetical protein
VIRGAHRAICTASRRHTLRGLLSGAACLALFGLFFAPQASALSKHAISSSLTGSGPLTFTNPTDVAFDRSSGGLYVANTPEDSRQRLEVDATGGKFRLAFKGQQTVAIPFNAGPTVIRNALEQLATIGPGNFELIPLGPSAYLINFQGSLSDAPQPQLSADTSKLSGGAATVHIKTLLPGAEFADVEKVTPTGEPIFVIGKAVNATTGGDLCVVSSGDSCQPGTPGTGPGAFSGFYEMLQRSQADPNLLHPVQHQLFLAIDKSTDDLYVGDPGNATVSKFNSEGEPIAAWGVNGRLDGSTAAAKGPFTHIDGLAVRPDGTLLVRRAGGSLFRFAPDGTFLSADQEGRAPDRSETVGDVFDPATRERYHIEREYIQEPMVVEHFRPSGASFETFGENELLVPMSLSLDPSTGTVYVADPGNRRVATFDSVPYLPDAIPSATDVSPSSETLRAEARRSGAGPVTGCYFEYGKTSAYGSGVVPCDPGASTVAPFNDPATQVSAEIEGLEYATTYHFRAVLENANGENASADAVFTSLPLPPQIETVAGQAFAESALFDLVINPGGGTTTYRIEYITKPAFENDGFEDAQSTPELEAGTLRIATHLVVHLSGLTPSTSYRYRVVATNASSPPGGVVGPESGFTTLPFASEPAEICPNSKVRQQGSAAQLLDCRAYELVSASDSAGYDVESSVIPGQNPYPGYPGASGRVLYGVHSGGIPGTNHPTNRGVDPYVAKRGADGWSTEYVGVPANNSFSAAPFSSEPSGADSGIDTLSFGRPGGCSPCFEGGVTGIPVRLPSGDIVQGMVAGLGVPTPGPSAAPDGYIAKAVSANGEHLIFGSTSRFAQGGNDATGDVSIYDRNLMSGETTVVSNTAAGGGTPGQIPCLAGAGKCNSGEGDGNGVGELDISEDGTRVLLGQLVSESGGEKTWHLYMDVHDSDQSIDLTPEVISTPGGPGYTEGVHFNGMTADGSRVFFTTTDQLATTTDPDADSSADLYEARISGSHSALSRVSIGAEGTGDTDACDPAANTVHPHWNATGSGEDCSVVAIGGSGGVASSDGAIYFLSPEQLDGLSKGVANAPNLYVARPEEAPHFVATLESSASAPLPPTERALQRSFGHFEIPAGVAVTRRAGEEGDTYVLDLTNEEGQGNVRKFDPSGNLVTSFGIGGKITGTPPFEELGASKIPTQIAVDNDPGSDSYGDIYIPNLFGGVEKYSPAGVYVGSLAAELPTGVAVNQSTGEVSVTELFGGVHVFDDQGKDLLSFPTINEPTGVAVAGDGTTYVVNGGGFGGAGETKIYDASGTPVGSLPASKSIGVAIDAENENIYVDEGDQVVEFSSAGAPVGAPTGTGRLGGSISLAAYKGELYVSNQGAGPTTGVIDVYGHPVLPPDRATDNQLVIDSVGSPEERRTADFQVTPDGETAAFPSTLSLAARGEDPAGHIAVFRYRAVPEQLDCVSCTLSGFPSAGDSSLAANGLSLTDDGRVFFDSDDHLLASDTDEKRDVYEWELAGTGNCDASSATFVSGACVALVSAGTSTFDSGLLSATSSATDAYFFTRDSLVPQDENGPTIKIYDARTEGGFFFEYPPVTCRASDECHGAASPAPGPIPVGSGTITKHTAAPSCKPHFVLKHNRCVKKPKGHKRHKNKRRKHGRGRHGGKK